MGAQRVRRQPEGTVLYRMVQAEWWTFVQRVEAGERVVPRFCGGRWRGSCGAAAWPTGRLVRVRITRVRAEMGALRSRRRSLNCKLGIQREALLRGVHVPRRTAARRVRLRAARA